MDFHKYAAQIIAKHGASLHSNDVLDIATSMIVRERGHDRSMFFFVPANAWGLMNAYRAMSENR